MVITSSQSKNLILVDVDGVLNPDSPSDSHTAHKLLVRGSQYTVHLNVKHGEWLVQLAEETDSELVWCTYWEKDAPEILAPILSLPVMAFVPIKLWKMGVSLGAEKAHSAKEYAGNRKFAYFDDEYDIADYLTDTNGVHIYVDPDAGLQPYHVAQAKHFLLS